MAKDEMNLHSEALERKILLALETAPRVDVPEGFAARIARQLPPQPAVVLTPARYGLRAAVACVAVLIALMLVSAPLAMGNSTLWLSLESIFCAQFGLLAVWLVARRYRSPSSF